jgi:hypothetical protein
VHDPTHSSRHVARDPRQATVVVGSYADYADAERVVDRLSHQGFPVEHVTIVGRDMHMVERVIGRMGYPEAALRGALAGAVAGALIGWLFFVFDWFVPAVARGWLIVDGLWFGAVAGAIAGLIAHALLRGHRDFDSIVGMAADRYDVLVDQDVADRAMALLSESERFERAEAARQTEDAAAVEAGPSDAR